MSDLAWKTPPQEPEGIRWRTVLVSMVSTLLLFGAGVAVQWTMAKAEMSGRNPHYDRGPPLIGSPTINLLEQVPFPVASSSYQDQAKRLQQLESYGWVDRAQGIIHVPIENAFQELLATPPAKGL